MQACPTTGPITADGQVPTATLAGLRIAHERDMEAPAAGRRPDAPAAESDDTKAEAAEATKDEPAPGPSATVPAEPATTETDPKQRIPRLT